MTDPLVPVMLAADARSVRIIDQRALPSTYVERDLHSVDDVIDAIHTLAVRGAPAIGIAGAAALAIAAQDYVALDARAAQLNLIAVGARVAAARPTAVNLRWAVERVLARVARTPGNGAAIAQAAVAEVQSRVSRLLNVKGKRTVASFHRELGAIMWDKCGMARDAAGLREALQKIPALREEFWSNVNVPGSAEGVNTALDVAGRVADFLELAELMCTDALHREESCGGHFRTEHQTSDGEAERHDADFAYAAAWEWLGSGKWQLHKDPLTFENVQLATRSYK